MIVIADYGMGNVGSIQRMFKKIGVESCLGTRPDQLESASALVLPGVGAFDHAMDRLDAVGFRRILDRLIQEQKIPVLGICLGMQLLFDRSEEGQRTGLGWLAGDVKKFRPDSSLRLPIPNMGWCDVSPISKSGLFDDSDENPRFYFVHSYHVVPASKDVVIGTAHYGYEFCCAVRRDNIIGVQFHPEKSHRFGMRLLTQFAKTVNGVTA